MKTYKFILLAFVASFIAIFIYGCVYKISGTEHKTTDGRASTKFSEFVTDFGGLTIGEIYDADIYNNINKVDLFSGPNAESNVEIRDPGDCNELRDILVKGSRNPRPVYISLDKNLSESAKDFGAGIRACTTDEKTFEISRDSDIIIDGGGVDNFLIEQEYGDCSDELKNCILPLLKITNNRNVILKGFTIKGARTGIQVLNRANIFVGDVAIETKDIGIFMDEKITSQRGQAGFTFIREVQADLSDVCYLDGNSGDLASDGCLRTVAVGGLTITTPGVGIKVRHVNAMLVVDEGNLVINDANTGLYLTQGTVLIRNGGMLEINNYGNANLAETPDLLSGDSGNGINFVGGELNCLDVIGNGLRFTGAKAPLKIGRGVTDLGTCIPLHDDGTGSYSKYMTVTSTNVWKYSQVGSGFGWKWKGGEIIGQ